jgi:hypothetical protein
MVKSLFQQPTVKDAVGSITSVFLLMGLNLIGMMT